MRTRRGVTVALAAVFVAAGGARAADDAAEASAWLERADRFRSAWPSFVLRTRIDNYQGDRLVESADFDVSIKGESSFVRFLSARNKGHALLMRGDDMWYLMPSTSRPIRITPIQRLMGNASNGDVARLRFAIDYDATLAGEEEIGGEPCVVLDLHARRKGATYQRVRYAVRRRDAQPVRAEYFLTSGKQAKTAFFEEPRLEAGHTIVTRLVLHDQLKPDSRTVMQLGGFRPRALPDKLFNPVRAEGQ